MAGKKETVNKKGSEKHNDRKDEPKRLYRSRQDRMIAGVCGGIAEYLRVDPVWVRLAFVLLIFAKGIGLLLYLIFWIITPKNPGQDDISREKLRETVAGRVTSAIEDDINEHSQEKAGIKKESAAAAKSARLSPSSETIEPAASSGGRRSGTGHVLLAILLILINVLFVLWIFVALGAVLIGLFAAGIGLIVGSIVLLAASIIAMGGTSLFALGIHPAAGVLFSIGLSAMGVLVLIGSWYLSKLFYKATAAYLRLNARIISGRD